MIRLLTANQKGVLFCGHGIKHFNQFYRFFFFDGSKTIVCRPWLIMVCLLSEPKGMGREWGSEVVDSTITLPKLGSLVPRLWISTQFSYFFQWSSLENKLNFSVWYQNALCVFLQPDKHVECIFSIIKHLQNRFLKYFETFIIYIHLFSLAVFSFPGFWWHIAKLSGTLWPPTILHCTWNWWQKTILHHHTLIHMHFKTNLSEKQSTSRSFVGRHWEWYLPVQ